MKIIFHNKYLFEGLRFYMIEIYLRDLQLEEATETI
jgi:hypothetical protein